MKKIVLLWILLIGWALIGCNKPVNCEYITGTDLMEYDPVTKECDCVNKDLLLALNTGYNTWNDFMRYMVFYYRADKLQQYPYYFREGDTVHVCGWIAHDGNLSIAGDIEDSTLVQFDILDDSLSAMNAGRLTSFYHIEGGRELMDSIDRERKCYIDGVITFNPRPHPNPPMSTIHSDSKRDCITAVFSIRMFNIKNQAS